jgi:multiple sugar transport system permease protein
MGRMANLTRMQRREELEGYLWVSPWFIGFLAFTFLPFLASFVLGFTDWNGVGTPKFVGLQNYIQLFTADPLFWQSLKVTFIFAILYLPLSLILGFGLALLMNQPLPGMRIFRTLYYAPSILSGVAVAVLWGFIFNQNFGVLNWMLHFVGIKPIPWLESSFWVIPAFVIMQLWGVGGSMLIYLAGIQGVPTELYDAALVDGANWRKRLRHITLPMTSPTILFNLVLGLIGTFQIFTQAYIITQGGPNYGSYFYALNLYDTAFQDLRLGYASSMATVLFVIIALSSMAVFRWSRTWVYYAGRGGAAV